MSFCIQTDKNCIQTDKKKYKTYKNDSLRNVSYPLGGIGAGMFCIEGTGMLRNFSIRNEPNFFNNPNIFAALTVKNNDSNISKVLEGQVPYSKVYGFPYVGHDHSSGNGMSLDNFGLSRFENCTFHAKFPFAHISLNDGAVPVKVKIEAFSPFIPNDEDNSSLPVASIKYDFINTSNKELDLVFYFSSMQFMGIGNSGEGLSIKSIKNGFVMSQSALPDKKWARGDFVVSLNKKSKVNCDFFRGQWWDAFTVLWNDISKGKESNCDAKDHKSPGASISHSFKLMPGKKYSITVRFSWYVPDTFLRYGNDVDDITCQEKTFHKPWYSDKFTSGIDVMKDFSKRYNELYRKTKIFSNSFYSSSLPLEVLDAVTSNLVILKSPTVLRQTDGRFWAWEGCVDTYGSCHGSCTHVWNYAQAICNLFPKLEQSLRESEFFVSQDENGHQTFRTSLPIRKVDHTFHAASDGQLGGIMKLYREWRISGNDNWILKFWDKILDSINYCIKTWDPNHIGVLMEPHHNTYDIEFWGADAMCSSFYLGALKAVTEIGKHFGFDTDYYYSLYCKGKEYIETKLWNGEYFIQIPEWKTLNAKFDISREYGRNLEILTSEGPKYQYGTGCISDGVLGCWLAKICGLGDIIDKEKVKSHLLSVYKYNFKKSLINHSSTQRPGYALGKEGGLLLCTWPRGGKPSLPFVYSDEVWTGIEYQVASHLAFYGFYEESLDIISTLRERYNGIKRNPFDEYECGHWYARALASYSLLEAFTGVSYDSRSKVLTAKKGKYTTFLSTSDGYGLVTCNNDKIEMKSISGSINVNNIIFID